MARNGPTHRPSAESLGAPDGRFLAAAGAVCALLVGSLGRPEASAKISTRCGGHFRPMAVGDKFASAPSVADDRGQFWAARDGPYRGG